jgi:hypothetical protein
MRHIVFWLAIALTALPAWSARADLASDAEELARRWAATGQKTLRLSPMFLEHGRPRAVRVPEAAFEPKGAGCTTVAFLTGRSTDFVVRIDPLASPKHHGANGHLERSIAGAVLLSQCGAARDAFLRLAIELRVARSAVETVIAVGDVPAIPIAEALPERASGPVAPLADPGPRSPLEPLAVRARHAEQRVKNTGPTSMHTQVFSAEPDGTGREVVRLEEGCHRIELLAELLGRSPIDLDAELREAASERLIARDRSDAADVRLDLCSGATTAADLLFAGAPGPVPVLLVDSLYALPKGVPVTWGARARAGLAAALWRRKLPPVESDPIEQRLGVAGLTSMAITVEPGNCYVMAIAAMRGDPRSITMSARVDTRVTFDSTAGILDGSALGFCSAGADKAYVDLEVRGSAVAWVLALWQLGTRPFDEGR